jgi:hypothetical protein
MLDKLGTPLKVEKHVLMLEKDVFWGGLLQVISKGFWGGFI